MRAVRVCGTPPCAPQPKGARRNIVGSEAAARARRHWQAPRNACTGSACKLCNAPTGLKDGHGQQAPPVTPTCVCCLRACERSVAQPQVVTVCWSSQCVGVPTVRDMTLRDDANSCAHKLAAALGRNACTKKMHGHATCAHCPCMTNHVYLPHSPQEPPAFRVKPVAHLVQVLALEHASQFAGHLTA